MAEVTDQGYVLKTQNQYFDEEKQLYLDIDPNWNLDPSTPDGLKIAHDAEVFGNLDESLQAAYNSKDPNKSRGVELNVVSALTGTFRSDGTPSNVALTLGGVAGTVILAGKIVESTVDQTQWTIDANVTIGVGGTVTAAATAVVSGTTQADIGTITKIVDTVGGWQTVTNPSVATSGTNEETDSQLRIRRAVSVSRPGNAQVDSMLGEILATEGVRRAVIYENDTGVVQPVTGLPAHSIAPIVDGGTDEDVAKSIFIKKNPGVTLYAAGTSVVVPDVYNKYPSNKKDITFSRPSYVDMIVSVSITSDGSLPTNADDLVTQAILDYTTSELVAAECGFNQSGFDIGEDVPISRMYTPINQVIGQYGNSYVSSLMLQAGTVNIPIAFNELSRWTEANITVVVV
jgi:uncharacterized phage protein gp47/JayE